LGRSGRALYNLVEQFDLSVCQRNSRGCIGCASIMVNQNIRQLRIQNTEIRLVSRSAERSLDSSALHPDGLKHSGDETDARHLAHLLRLASCLPARYCRPRRAACVTWPGNACSWCAAAPPTFSQ
jgi:hypothetical protein